MKHFLLVSFILFFIAPVHAITGLNVCNYGKEQVSSVVCNGPAIMKQTRVDGDVDVTGSLQADMVSIKSMIIKGAAQLSHSEVSGSVNVAGDLNADNVIFKQGIAIQSDNIILSHTKVNGLVTITSPDKTPYLQIQCSSEVTGSILFDGKPGVVQITANDSIIRGKIINGSTEYITTKCER